MKRFTVKLARDITEVQDVTVPAKSKDHAAEEAKKFVDPTKWKKTSLIFGPYPCYETNIAEATADES